MKKLFTGALALLLLAGAAQAQTADSTRHHKGHGGHEWMQQLNLTADQKTQLRSIHEKQRADMKALKSNTSLTADQQKEKRKELFKSYRKQSMAVYTPEQKEQLKKFRAEHKGKGHGKDMAMRGHRHGGHAMMKQLNLTEAQKQQLKQFRTDGKSQFEALRNDKSLSDDQRKAKMKELRQQRSEQMKSVLTQEQLEKLKSMRKEHEAKNTK